MKSRNMRFSNICLEVKSSVVLRFGVHRLIAICLFSCSCCSSFESRLLCFTGTYLVLLANVRLVLHEVFLHSITKGVLDDMHDIPLSDMKAAWKIDNWHRSAFDLPLLFSLFVSPSKCCWDSCDLHPEQTAQCQPTDRLHSQRRGS